MGLDPTGLPFLPGFREALGDVGGSSSSLSMMMSLRDNESPRESVLRELSVLSSAFQKKVGIHIK